MEKPNAKFIDVSRTSIVVMGCNDSWAAKNMGNKLLKEVGGEHAGAKLIEVGISWHGGPIPEYTFKVVI